MARSGHKTLPQAGPVSTLRFLVCDALREVVAPGLLRFVAYSGSLLITKHQKQRSDPSILGNARREKQGHNWVLQLALTRLAGDGAEA